MRPTKEIEIKDPPPPDPHRFQPQARRLHPCARQMCPQSPLYQMRPRQKTSKSNETYKRHLNQMCTLRPLYQMRPTQKTSRSNETYKRHLNQMCPRRPLQGGEDV